MNTSASLTPLRRARTTRAGDLLPRILAASLGGYALCWSLISLLCAWLPLSKASLWFFTGQLVPLPFVGVLLWAFAAARAWQALAYPLTLAAILQTLAVLR